MMRRVKVPGLDIQIPPGSAFKIDTPLMMPKMHLLAAVVAPRGYGKGVITTNLIEQLKVVDRLILVSPSAASNKALNDRLKRILAPEDIFDDPNDEQLQDEFPYLAQMDGLLLWDNDESAVMMMDTDVGGGDSLEDSLVCVARNAEALLSMLAQG